MQVGHVPVAEVQPEVSDASEFRMIHAPTLVLPLGLVLPPVHAVGLPLPAGQ